MTSNEQLMELALRAARESGEILKSMFGGKLQKELKSRKNLVTEADKASEERVISILREGTPTSSILAEESPEMSGTSSLKWIIDPLDGTTNYAHALPHYSVSIGLEVDGQLTLGVVHNPMQHETFTAQRGQGAFLNGKRLEVSEIDDLEDALLVTGIPYDVLTMEQNNLDFFAAFCFEGQSVRRLGSAALDFCYVAAGRLDGFWELALHPWDMAAGVLIVEEAGGKVTDLKGQPMNIYGKAHVASNGRIHRQMLDVIADTLESS